MRKLHVHLIVALKEPNVSWICCPFVTAVTARTVCISSLFTPPFRSLQNLIGSFTQPVQWPLLLWYQIVIFALNINWVFRSPCWGVKHLAVMWASFRDHVRSRKRTTTLHAVVNAGQKQWCVFLSLSFVLELLLTLHKKESCTAVNVFAKWFESRFLSP